MMESDYHIKVVFSKQNFAHVGAERQANIQTYKHTNTQTFWKTNLVNQASAHSRPTPGLKNPENSAGALTLHGLLEL